MAARHHRPEHEVPEPHGPARHAHLAFRSLRRPLPSPAVPRPVLPPLRRAVDATRATVVMTTRDPVAASFADRVVFLSSAPVGSAA